MQEVINKNKEREGVSKFFNILLPFLPKLLFKFSITFLKFKRSAKKAEKVFRKELVEQGIDKQTASELTEIYMKSSKIQNFIQSVL
jgi:hypothetical protein